MAAIAPFAPDTPPADLPWLGNYADQISRLSKDRFYSDPLPTSNSFVILLWNDSLPAYKPNGLAEVREQVAADYRNSEKRRLFSERGHALKASLQAAAATPTGFADKAAAEKLEVKSYANFTLSKPPQDLPVFRADQALLTLGAGQVSDMMGTGDKGLHRLRAGKETARSQRRPNPRYVEHPEAGHRDASPATAKITSSASLVGARTQENRALPAPR